jgi:predicted RNase H-like nuclease
VNIDERVLGIDGACSGWAVANCKNGKAFVRFFKKIEDVWYFYRDKLELVLIDIPIGLPHSEKRYRSCDEEARKFLGHPRSSSIFSPPCREVFEARDYKEALAINKKILGKGLSKQAWNIIPKIKEVDEFIIKIPEVVKFLKESHPEVAFKGLKGEVAKFSKRDEEGYKERMEFLRILFRKFDCEIVEDKIKGLRRDDIVDALILLATGLLAIKKEGDICSFPTNFKEKDLLGLPMEIFFVKFSRLNEIFIE